jgi:hypothetical protein
MALLKNSPAINPAVAELLPRIRHSYRSLLREANYLADTTARDYFRRYIRFRFNPFNPEKLDPRYWGTNKFRNEIKVERVDDGLKDASSGLKTLMYANGGNLEALEKVFMRAYGRTGKRRRELIVDLSNARGDDLPQDDTALQQLIDTKSANKSSSGKEAPDINNPFPEINRTMRQFVASQQANQPPDSARGKIRKLAPNIPEKNIWGRNLPKKREANMRKKFWADIMARILPPLPAHEWDRLGSLAQGRMPLEQPPLRRTKVGEWPTSHSDSEIKASDLDSAALSKRFLTPARAQKSSTMPTDYHTSEGRALRRLYGKIWRLSAKMVQDERTKEFTITWGQEKSPAGAGLVTQPSKSDLELFEGLDSNEASARKAGKGSSKKRENTKNGPAKSEGRTKTNGPMKVMPNKL